MSRQKIILSAIIFFLLSNNQKIYGQVFSETVKQFIEVQDSIFAITNVKLIDGTGMLIKNNQDILIVGKWIKSIGQSGTVTIPKNSRIIDGTGKTVIPGLIMLHEHLFYAKPFDNNYKGTQMANTFPKMYLAGGVTTMRTAGGIEANTDLNIKNFINQGKMPGPKMDVSTPHIERESSIPQLQSLYGKESPERMIDYWVDKGITSVKVYNNITKDDLRRIIKAAHARKIKVTGHLCSISYREAAELGIDNMEHGFMASADFILDKKENDCDNGRIFQTLLNLDENNIGLKRLMEYLIKKNVTITYTPTVFEPFTNREVIPGGGMVALAPFLKDQIQTIYDANVNKDSLSVLSFKKEMKRIMQFYAMGGKIVAGTDPTGDGRTIAGYANQRAIELLIETGFTIEKAIKIATLNGAIYLEIAKQTGSLEPGKLADLVLINGDLQKDVSKIRDTEIVFKDGVGYSSKKIFDSVKGKIGAD
jgi:imidazolonepropionase-like amidohydrolase